MTQPIDFKSLTPPASPLDSDFARRTAQRVLERAGHDRRQREPLASSYARRLWTNPLQQIVRRQRTRRFFQLPSLFLLLLFYALPGAFFGQMGDADQQQAYFNVLKGGLTLIVPLALMAVEWTTLNTLVRGRCLEEMLSTGLAPALVSDTLALNGLRTLAPLLLMTCLLLTPVLGPEVMGLLPIGCLFLAGCNYPIQALVLRPRGARVPCLMAGVCGLGGLALSFPWNLLFALSLMSVTCRQLVLRELTALQQGHPPQTSVATNRRLRSWLSRYLPDLALLQREVRRGALLSPAWMGGSLAAVAGYWYVRGNLADGGWWPLFTGVLALWQAASLVQREQAAGTHEVLVHSGLDSRDWWLSCAWISALRLLPTALFLGIVVGWRLPLLAFGMLTLLLVANWAGAVLGVLSAWEGNLRSTLGRAFSHLVAIGGYVTAAGLMLSTLVSDSASARRLFDDNEYLMSVYYPLTQVIPFLLVGLALWARARQVTSAGWVERPSLPLLQMVPALPIAYFLQLLMVSSPATASWWTGVTLMFSTLWFFWAQPLLASPRLHAGRWAMLCTSYLLGVPLASYALGWLLIFHVSPQLLDVVAFGSQIDPLHLVLHVSIWSLVVARINWKMETPLPAKCSQRWRFPALVGSLVAALGVSWAQYLARPVPTADISAWRAKARPALPRRGPYRELLSNYARTHSSARFDIDTPLWVQGVKSHDLLQAELRQPLRRLIESGAPLDQSVPQLLRMLTDDRAEPEVLLENLEWAVRLLEQGPSERYMNEGSLYHLTGKLLTSGRLVAGQVNRLRVALDRLDGLRKDDQVWDSMAYFEQERLRRSGQQYGNSPEIRLYFGKQADLAAALFLQKRQPDDHGEPYQNFGYLYHRQGTDFSAQLALLRQGVRLEAIRVTTGAYPGRFWAGSEIRYRKVQDGYQLTGRLYRLDARGLRYGYRYR